MSTFQHLFSSAHPHPPPPPTSVTHLWCLQQHPPDSVPPPPGPLQSIATHYYPEGSLGLLSSRRCHHLLARRRRHICMLICADPRSWLSQLLQTVQGSSKGAKVSRKPRVMKPKARHCDHRCTPSARPRPLPPESVSRRGQAASATPERAENQTPPPVLRSVSLQQKGGTSGASLTHRRRRRKVGRKLKRGRVTFCRRDRDAARGHSSGMRSLAGSQKGKK